MRALLYGVLVLAAYVPPAFGQDAVPLDQAIKEHKVAAAITGRGGSTGDTILITVRRIVPEVLRLTVAPGTVFASVSGAVQDMAAASIRGEREGASTFRPEAEIVLRDGDEHGYWIEAYCLNFHKNNPQPSDQFRVSAVDPDAARLLAAAKPKSASIDAIQAALWMARERLSPEEIQRRFPLSSEDVRVAQSIVQEAGQSLLAGDDEGHQRAPRQGPVLKLETASAAALPQPQRGPQPADDRWTRVPGIVGRDVPANAEPSPERRNVSPAAPPANADPLAATGGEGELARRVATLESQVAELRRLNQALVDIVENHSVMLGQITADRTAANGGRYYVPNVNAISSDPKSRRALVDTVVKDITRSTGTLEIRNDMDSGQSLLINGSATVYVDGHSLKSVTVPCGTAITELVGASEGPRNWAIAAPTYFQSIIIAPNRGSSPAAARDQHLDPQSMDSWRASP